MKNIIIGGILVLAVWLFVPQMVQAQGTVYVSSLSQTSTGSHAAGSDSWLAADFFTGNNAGGYLLNSIQLGMTDASGSPSGFTVMLYSNGSFPIGVDPGISLGTLSGSPNPATSGIYTYTAPQNLTLLPGNAYLIVITSGTAIANGAYEWSESAFPPAINAWGAGNGVEQSNNGGSSWISTPYSGIAQFAVYATAVPEPDISCLFVLGALAFLWHRRKAGVV